MRAKTARVAAALIALTCWTGIGIDFAVRFGQAHQVVSAFWSLMGVFTIFANLAIAVAMTLAAFGRRLSAIISGGLTLAIVLVAVIYAALLAGLHPLTETAQVGSLILHKVVPAEMLLYWLFLIEHRRLGWLAPWMWLLFPATYLGYALVRGSFEGRYPYPFIDIGKIGLERALSNSAAIGAAFVFGGYLLVFVDRRLGSKHTTG
jgi:hypothetical protein